MDEKDFKKFIILVLIGVLTILSFLVIKPIITPVFLGLLLAYIFYHPHQKITQKFNSEKLSALTLVSSTFLVIMIPLIFLVPIFVRQLYNAYISLRVADFSAVIFKSMSLVHPEDTC